MFKPATIGEVKRGERTYILLCDSMSPLGEVHDVLMEMKGICVDKMIAAQKEEQAQVELQKQQEIQNE